MGVTVHFKGGQVVKIHPEPHKSYYEVRDIINSADTIVSDGVKYNLNDIESIRAITVPDYSYSHPNLHAQDLGVTGCLEYVLRMHAGKLWDEFKYGLALACLGKACQLMLYSTIGWARKDYYRIVYWELELGRIKKANEWKAWIEKYTPSFDDVCKESFEEKLESCRYLETDLVETASDMPCCENCAKYTGRILSLSGKDKRFFKFPADFHYRCLHIYPFVEDVMEPQFKVSDYIAYSRRPLIDERTPEEKQRYEDWVEIIRKDEDFTIEPNLNHIIYYWFKPKFPDDFPKSLSGFSRMRNSNSKNYQKLMSKIADSGCWIPETIDDVIAWDEENN